MKHSIQLSLEEKEMLYTLIQKRILYMTQLFSGKTVEGKTSWHKKYYNPLISLQTKMSESTPLSFTKYELKTCVSLLNESYGATKDTRIRKALNAIYNTII